MSLHTIDVLFDLERKELMIDFASHKMARNYQQQNPEARIFSGHESCVWLPITSDMKYLRYSYAKDGFCIVFNSPDAADDWLERSVLGMKYNPMTSKNDTVYFQRQWEMPDLHRRLGIGVEDPPPPDFSTALVSTSRRLSSVETAAAAVTWPGPGTATGRAGGALGVWRAPGGYGIGGAHVPRHTV